MRTDFPNWFKDVQSNFVHLEEFLGKPVSFLQIGVYTGNASVWMMENILINPESKLVDVDVWENNDHEYYSDATFNEVEHYYDTRMKKYKNVEKHKTTSDEYFKQCNEMFDFIYIDGDHTESQTYADAINSWGKLKNGGILAFDDYGWGTHLSPEQTPKPAIDRFLAEKSEKYTILVNSYQVWVRKNAN